MASLYQKVVDVTIADEMTNAVRAAMALVGTTNPHHVEVGFFLGSGPVFVISVRSQNGARLRLRGQGETLGAALEQLRELLVAENQGNQGRERCERC